MTTSSSRLAARHSHLPTQACSSHLQSWPRWLRPTGQPFFRRCSALMSSNTRQKRQESQALFLEYLIDWVGPSGKREFMMSDFRDYCGFTRNMTEDYVSAFDKIGLIRKSGVWKRMTKGKRSFGANHTTIELLDSPDDLRAKLRAVFDEENRTGNTIV